MNDIDKLYIPAEQLLKDSYHLAWQVFESGFRPEFIVGVWRGGAPVGIAVQEFLALLGLTSDHIAIRTSSYSGMDKRETSVQVFGLNYIIRKVESDDSLLIVDDVFDTGLSYQKVISDIRSACKKNTPHIRIATPYFKPANNQSEIKPDYFLHETDKWLGFPHELDGLTVDELRENKPALSDLIDYMVPILKKHEN